MNTAIVFVNAQVDQVPEVAEALAAIPGVTEVYSVTGAIDLVAIVRTRTVEEVAEVVTGRMNKVPGILDTQTHLAFRAYSAHDLEAAFSLGE
ncbi:Lrp/AsnC ligand binding domain-containing protein [Propioniciclava sp.]|uniref:Lrp/AsnC family transcriptional regulator n=1 Tax=Propioniciclava sp. TaxID=2038686 RepID=UPI002601FCE8|nr:Lrp/AsnC ligand binding domain-containing protein [Propioniciclava sp.]